MVNSLLTLFLLSAGLFIYGWKLKTKLLSNSIWTPSEKARKVEVLMRINTVLGICCMCFLLRVICLIGVIIDDIREVSLTDQVTEPVWFTISNFIPTLCPVRQTPTLLLYIYIILFLCIYHLCGIYDGLCACLSLHSPCQSCSTSRVT